MTTSPVIRPAAGSPHVPDAAGSLRPGRTSTTPAASRSSPRCAARRATTSSTPRSTALRNLEHRGAVGADAGHRRRRRHPHPDPDAFLRDVVDFELPAGRARTPSASPSCPTTTTSDAPPRRRIEAIAAEEGLSVLGWRDVPVDAATWSARTARACHARLRASCSSRRAAATRPGALGHRRSTGGRSACASAPSASSASTSPSLSARTLVYKGMLTTLPAGAVLPRPVRRALRLRARARALALLDEHVPVLAARAAVPA